MHEYLVCLIPKYSAQNITSNLAICFWNIADYFGILVILQAIFNRILIGIRGFSCSVGALFAFSGIIKIPYTFLIPKLWALVPDKTSSYPTQFPPQNMLVKEKRTN